MPIARDVDQQSRSIFDVQGLPTMFILGPTARWNRSTSATSRSWPRATAQDRSAAGGRQPVSAGARAGGSSAGVRNLLGLGQSGSGETVEIPKATIAPRSEPRQLKLHRCGIRTRRPGRATYCRLNKPTAARRLYVNDGWRTVVALDGRGQLAGRYELDIPEEAAISFLRTAADAQGSRYFAGSASAQQQLFVFDGSSKNCSAFRKENMPASLTFAWPIWMTTVSRN